MLNIDSLPYRPEVLSFLEQQHTTGRPVILYTSTPEGLAKQFVDKFPFFDAVIASNDARNRKMSTKSTRAEETWGRYQYDYLGDSDDVSEIWMAARRVIGVGKDDSLKVPEKPTKLEKHFKVKSAGVKGWLKAIRIHQWSKNALLFVPLLTAQKLLDVDAMSNALIAFISFGLCASATYLLNDLLDLESDRKHYIKKKRPLAAGLIGIDQAVVMSIVLMSVGLLFAVLVNVYFLLALLAYLLMTVLYSFKLKSLQTVDVIVLASLFTIRVIAGGAAINVELSFWLLCFSMFLFLSLAMVKRVSELISVEKNNQPKAKKIDGRGYFTADIAILQSLGAASGFIAVLVFALYINSAEVTKIYHYPQILWLICPIFGYWIMRVWVLTARDEMDQDPISFAITDKNSWLAAFLVLSALFVASYL